MKVLSMCFSILQSILRKKIFQSPFMKVVNEAEMMSLNQQKRIEELEAQLREAEDIVRDLRAELREVQDELEKLTKNSIQCSSEQKSGHDVITSSLMNSL
ncbi:hypothetical protein E1A91_D03G056400v1 [Gossypium mustelinum]|uniref:Uncharacterized protein n=1 Tax=Gossypium mustelinum TaxID=34275 RepID=A0A5D2VIY1_GOSMU|nr:hypothetical protein E1A91_D03G056400v1 [Gossypium mustelinum]TYI89432.1 hypothetical protein E1A91_D03G056400v1 [Gossypium mustelinum]TYI89433.1 hypothetical protein E1A91_D03G056400v1 [Gossypium mustelinum]